MLWDIFCKVIDNLGDIGVTWRLSAELAARGHRVRLWVDEPGALAWMAPKGHPAVEVHPWTGDLVGIEPGDAVIEAFGCDPPAGFLATLAAKTARQGRQPAWINLEYLSAEGYVERSHGLPSPVFQGPAAGLAKRFFYPGFTQRTGGLLRERALESRQAAFSPREWLAAQGVLQTAGAQVFSLFCYEPLLLGQLLTQLAQRTTRTHLLVTAGRARQATERALHALASQHSDWNAAKLLSIGFLPLLSQPEYDHLLWSCDLNFVRGEDSLVRALWSGRPFVWQIYPQHDRAHAAKLEAFLDWLQAPPSLRQFHRAWNDLGAMELPLLGTSSWSACAELARQRALALPELGAALEECATVDGRI